MGESCPPRTSLSPFIKVVMEGYQRANAITPAGVRVLLVGEKILTLLFEKPRVPLCMASPPVTSTVPGVSGDCESKDAAAQKMSVDVVFDNSVCELVSFPSEGFQTS